MINDKNPKSKILKENFSVPNGLTSTFEVSNIGLKVLVVVFFVPEPACGLNLIFLVAKSAFLSSSVPSNLKGFC